MVANSCWGGSWHFPLPLVLSVKKTVLSTEAESDHPIKTERITTTTSNVYCTSNILFITINISLNLTPQTSIGHCEPLVLIFAVYDFCFAPEHWLPEALVAEVLLSSCSSRADEACTPSLLGGRCCPLLQSTRPARQCHLGL